MNRPRSGLFVEATPYLDLVSDDCEPPEIAMNLEVSHHVSPSCQVLRRAHGSVD